MVEMVRVVHAAAAKVARHGDVPHFMAEYVFVEDPANDGAAAQAGRTLEELYSAGADFG